LKKSNLNSFLFLKVAFGAAILAALTVPTATAQTIDIQSYGAKCDGSDDSAAVQSAFDAVGSGGTVSISCSAGIGSSGILLHDKNNVTVAGTGGNAGFRALAPGSQTAGNFSGILFVARNCTSCVIRDLVIDIQNVAGSGVGFDKNTGSTLQNVSVSNVGYPALAAVISASGHNNNWLNNTVTNCAAGPVDDGPRGMWIGNTGYTEYSPTISGNTVSYTGWTGIANHPVNATITNNYVYHARGAGIKVTPPPGVASKTTVSGNRLTNNDFHGVQVSGADWTPGSPDTTVDILNNTLDSNGVSGIYTSGGHFAGHVGSNTITNNPEAGMYLYNVDGVQVDNNQITGNGHGITVEVDNGYNLNGLQINSNTFDSNKSDGISVWMRGGSLQNMSMNSNSFTNNAQNGIFVEWNSGNLNAISASQNCFAGNGSSTIYDQSGHMSPVASSGSCAPAGSGNNQKDTTPPQVSITAPGNGSTVNGTVTLTATASDNVGVTGVQFVLNGANYGPKLGNAPFSTQWDTKSVANGSYQWNAIASDAAGNTTTSATIMLNVNNPDTTPPTVQITSPANGSKVSGTVNVAASASDNVGVAGVQYSLDGSALGAELTASPYSFSWNTSGLAVGNHTLTATARDAAGNRSTSSVTVTAADTIPPTVSITSPANGQTVSGTVNLTASATDNVGVVGVQFLVDGANYGAEQTSGYSISLNTTTLTNGAHTISATARDAAGNKKTSTVVSVTVSNTTTPAPQPSNAVVRVNAGGSAYSDASGNAWSADSGFNGGSSYPSSNSISGTTSQPLYQTSRWNYGQLNYNFPVANGNYTVNLKFAETYMNGPGQRAFSIMINGQTVQSNFDIFAAAGGANKAVDKSFPVTVTGGSISIQMTSSVENPTVSGIEILQVVAPKSVVRVNVGGSAMTDSAGKSWSADSGYNGGTVYAPGVTVSGTADQALYGTQRWTYGTLTYTFPVNNGNYTVNLKMAELYMGGPGQRVMNIAINGQTVQTNLDIFAAAGGANKAIDKAFQVNVTGGSITIQLTSTVDNPTVSAIEIY
jgi:parallel beta-helix repeat protein